MVSWIEGLTSSQFKQIEEFFDTMPKLSHTVEVMNPNTQKKNTVVLEGLTSFFRLVMSQMNLEAYYRINFALMQFHKYSLTEIENMMLGKGTFMLDYLNNILKTRISRPNKGH